MPSLPKYARIPLGVLNDVELSCNAKVVYMELSSHAYQGNAVKRSIRQLAEDRGCTTNTVIRAVRELEARGHIKIHRTPKKQSHYILTSNVFGQKQRSGTADEMAGKPRKRLVVVRTENRGRR